jgi:hypothetical protein
VRIPRLAATRYIWLGDDEAIEEHARGFIAYRVWLDGSLNAPVRTAISTTVILQAREH